MANRERQLEAFVAVAQEHSFSRALWRQLQLLVDAEQSGLAIANLFAVR